MRTANKLKLASLIVIASSFLSEAYSLPAAAGTCTTPIVTKCVPLGQCVTGAACAPVPPGCTSLRTFQCYQTPTVPPCPVGTYTLQCFYQ